ncbi:MAG: pseudaminic acid synthase [Candidatus Omnitrophica bacterium]|nr:pseudaminic acid synthase [Candidatus Omnitrophota bacterium]MCF7888034.1 pseudaminic acid synthase [Candidatus Omnitrophota bacterium]
MKSKCMKKEMKNFNREDHTFIIAEVSANHGQDFDRAVEMVKTAKECGADAVKFQCFKPETLTLNCDNKYFQVEHPQWGGQTLYELYKKAYTPWEWFPKLKEVAEKEDILFFATTFDKSSTDFLEELDVPIHKIASFELVDLPLIKYTAKTKKPLIISTGMGSMEEIKEAVDIAKKQGVEDLTLLKCVSSYPAEPEEINLKTLPDMKERFDCKIGLSDHTLGIGVSIAAVALGARVIEKHFTLSRDIKTPDSFFSIEPDQLKELVENNRIAEKAIGEIHYGLTEKEKQSKVFRRSLFAVKDIKKDEEFTEENVKSIRPGYGLKPKYLAQMLGKKAKEDIGKGIPLR